MIFSCENITIDNFLFKLTDWFNDSLGSFIDWFFLNLSTVFIYLFIYLFIINDREMLPLCPVQSAS